MCDVQGLSSFEAAARLRLHGPNELAKDPPTPLWKMFLEQFTDLLVILLIIASIIAGALGACCCVALCFV
jgi:Ca2+-transporting ATPase